MGRLEDLPSYLSRISSAAQTLTASDAVFVLGLDQAGRTFSLLCSAPAPSTASSAPRMSLAGSAAGRAVTQGRTIVASRAEDGGEPLGPDDLTLTSETRSVLAVPLMVKGKAVGVLLAANKDGSHYTGEDTAILETLAAPAALAIENADLQQRMDESSAAYSELDRLKTDFIAITSHELRTPLGLILGHATFLRELAGSQYGEQLDVVIKNASRLKEIVESLSNMDNFKTGGARLHLKAISLLDLVDEVLDTYSETAAKRGITLALAPASEDLTVEADRTKIGIALGNLVRNALAFTDSGGHVLIKTEAIEGFAKVSVIDDGVGIPANDLPRIFERFFQVESHLTRHHGGMGLGLSVAKAMVEMHGGRIWAESTEGKGSQFSVLIPAAAPGSISNPPHPD